MSEGEPLRSLRVQGLKSIKDATLDLSSDISLLVGANGSGKSNFISAFEFLSRVVEKRLNDTVLRSGGMGALQYRRNADVSSSGNESIVLTAWGQERNGLSNGYEAEISAVRSDEAVVAETTYFHDRNRYVQPMNDYLGLSRESQLREKATSSWRLSFAADVLEGCRVFHFDDVSFNAPPKQRVDVGDNLTLSADARNLSAVLLRIRTSHPKDYARIIRTIRTVAPFFEDFVLREDSGSLLLRWTQRGLDHVFSADSLSDGTLRFICLVVLFLQDDSPKTIVLDEPELGLHPFAVYQLAALMRKASHGRKIVAATQSVTLLEQFSIDEVVIVERSDIGTSLTRPKLSELTNWLDDYSLGELWQKNILGGRPQGSQS